MLFFFVWLLGFVRFGFAFWMFCFLLEGLGDVLGFLRDF